MGNIVRNLATSPDAPFDDRIDESLMSNLLPYDGFAGPPSSSRD
jgi:hypothetical protein